jgi:hypothetical protein
MASPHGLGFTPTIRSESQTAGAPAAVLAATSYQGAAFFCFDAIFPAKTEKKHVTAPAPIQSIH